MDPHRGFHRRLLNKRQGLDGVVVLESFIPTNSSTPSTADHATTTATSQSTGNPFSGIIDGVSSLSLVSNITPAALPSSGPSPAATSTTPLTPSSSSSTGSTTTPTSSARSTTPTSSSTSASTSTSATPTPSTPSGVGTVHTTTDGTSVIYLTSTLSSPSATSPPHSSFLQNPPLEGGIFALVGIVVLVIAFIVLTWALRKRRRARLDRDLAAAITFDPSATEHYEHQGPSIEKRPPSRSSSGHEHSYGYGMQMQPTYAPQQEYHRPMDYGRYPMMAYNAAFPPNSIPYRAPSPTVPQAAAQGGGANLTRKFSDRKPVPPLFPDPTHDPSIAHVSTPPLFYQQ